MALQHCRSETVSRFLSYVCHVTPDAGKLTSKHIRFYKPRERTPFELSEIGLKSNIKISGPIEEEEEEVVRI
jgi:hypothetical protein